MPGEKLRGLSRGLLPVDTTTINNRDVLTPQRKAARRGAARADKQQTGHVSGLSQQRPVRADTTQKEGQREGQEETFLETCKQTPDPLFHATPAEYIQSKKM